jgi:hypothetical protein
MNPFRFRTWRIALVTLALLAGGCDDKAAPDAPVIDAPLPPTALLVVGNSITKHAPIPAHGWLGDWGMTASSAESDFYALLRQHTGLSGQRFYFAGIERNPLPAMVWIDDVAAEVTPTTVVVVQLADNVPLQAQTIADFSIAYDALLAALADGAQLVCVGGWWYREPVESVVVEACTRHGGKYVYIGDLWQHPDNEDKLHGPQYDAYYINEHPHDWSMARIASRILAALE